jgi:hypothetical protein
MIKPHGSMQSTGNISIAQVVEGILNIFKPRFKILAYHSVDNVSHDTYEVRADNFQRHMRFLATNEYNVIPLEDAYKNILNQKIHDRTIVITFRDFGRLVDTRNDFSRGHQQLLNSVLRRK